MGLVDLAVVATVLAIFVSPIEGWAAFAPLAGGGEVERQSPVRRVDHRRARPFPAPRREAVGQ